ncbi:MAG: D-alanyl-D-alanine carboxypeptidase family protein [Dehalococcoidia bacterium]
MSPLPAPPLPRLRRGRLTTTLVTLVAGAALTLLVACSGDASATEVRANGNPIAPAEAPGIATAVTAAAPGAKTTYLVPPPSAPAPQQPVPVSAPPITARAAIVVDDASGAVLYEMNGRTRVQPASLTKIATAALAIDRGKLDEWVTIDFNYDQPGLDDASVMGLKEGDRFQLRHLIYGMLLPSGADASIAIGRAVSGSDAAFVRDLNAFMESLGLFDTHFIDPHGLGGPTHLSTAYDIAMLSRYAMRQPLFADAAKTEVYLAGGSRTLKVFNTNPWEFTYEGGDGVKSGFTEEAGPTLSASATRNGHRVFVVVMDANLRNQDTTALMDWAFNTFCWGDGALGCVPAGGPAGSAASPAEGR